MSFTDFNEQIWETEQIMEVPVYRYLQFKSVQDALMGNAGLAPILREMGISDVPADINCIHHGDIVDIQQAGFSALPGGIMPDQKRIQCSR